MRAIVRASLFLAGIDFEERLTTMQGKMLWFNEQKEHGFILTDEGERLYVHRDGFSPGEVPVGRCAHLVVQFEVVEETGERMATGVSAISKDPSPRARRRGASRAAS
jgi:cold shock CspA family protein